MEALREAFHIGPTTAYADRVEYDRYVAIVHAQLDKASFTAAWAEGRTMTLEQAIACALLVLETPLPTRAVKEGFGGLTAREQEAAALIAQGKSNREIAAAMTVGVKTAETYVTRILNKLGFDSRVQIAIWAIEKSWSQPLNRQTVDIAATSHPQHKEIFHPGRYEISLPGILAALRLTGAVCTSWEGNCRWLEALCSVFPDDFQGIFDILRISTRRTSPEAVLMKGEKIRCPAMLLNVLSRKVCSSP
jgi:DNA-binding CsgD family transcriptional regulator